MSAAFCKTVGSTRYSFLMPSFPVFPFPFFLSLALPPLLPPCLSSLSPLFFLASLLFLFLCLSCSSPFSPSFAFFFFTSSSFWGSAMSLLTIRLPSSKKLPSSSLLSVPSFFSTFSFSPASSSFSFSFSFSSSPPRSSPIPGSSTATAPSSQGMTVSITVLTSTAVAGQLCRTHSTCSKAKSGPTTRCSTNSVRRALSARSAAATESKWWKATLVRSEEGDDADHGGMADETAGD
mmetsp:Transcript_5535/g.10404  ORF Transcript_5535/g.10404 Transcript_5535/m.10404 type:complete len:235 (+) Transcript_5535:2253-2957(+)